MAPQVEGLEASRDGGAAIGAGSVAPQAILHDAVPVAHDERCAASLALIERVGEMMGEAADTAIQERFGVGIDELYGIMGGLKDAALGKLKSIEQIHAEMKAKGFKI